MQTIEIAPQHDIYSVSRLNNEVHLLLEDTFPNIWVEGEISNFAAPHSGHWYFSLKDAAAQVRCAMFRGNQRQLQFIPKDGTHVLLRGRVSLYENRGEYQLIVDYIEERGEGKLLRAFEALKKKLAAAGLFDIAHKKTLPNFPQCIGVITSPTGAAINDILTVLKRRFACANVIIYPTLVQGNTAAPAIVNAIQTANHRCECDVLIVARGGGSLEDLWPFNEEIVAQAIHQSALPIITGIGHEVDFTIADFVADQRAPTPSAAAEIVTPDKIELLALLTRHQQHILKYAKHRLTILHQQLSNLQKQLAQQHPKRRLAEKAQYLDFCELNLMQWQQRLFNQFSSHLKELHLRLQHQAPNSLINRCNQQTHILQHRLSHLMLNTLNKQQQRLAHLAATLDALSPLATLNRGYAIAMKVSSDKQEMLTNTTQVKSGDAIKLRLKKGELDCVVK